MTLSALHIEDWFGWAVRGSVQAGLLALVVLAVQRILRGRLSAGWRYALWLLVLGRLVVAIGPSSHTSLFNLVPSAESAPAAPDDAPAPAVGQGRAGGYTNPWITTAVVAWQVVRDYLPADHSTWRSRWQARQKTSPGAPPTTPPAEAGSPPASVSAGASPARSTRDWVAWSIPRIWAAGAIALLGRLMLAWVALRVRLRRWRPCRDTAVLDEVHGCQRELGVRRPIRVVWAGERTSPAVTGVLRPTLLLPADFAEVLSADERRFVLLHEMGHLRRQDVLIHWVSALMTALHWFNPLIWLAASRARADRELACDALVLGRTGQRRNTEYGLTIVKLLERVTCRGFLPGAVGISENKRQIKRRIRMIASFRLGTWRTRLVGVVVMAALCAVGLTDARADLAPRPKTPAAPAPKDAPPAAGVTALDALALVPSDSTLVVVAPSWEKLEKAVDQYAKLVAPAGVDVPSLSALVSHAVNLAGTDPAGAVAMFGGFTVGPRSFDVVGSFVLAVKDYDAFCKANNVEQKAGLDQITLGGQAFNVTKRGGFAEIRAIEARPAGAGKKPAPVAPLAEKLTADQKELLAGSDVFCHVDAPSLAAGLKKVLGNGDAKPGSDSPAGLPAQNQLLGKLALELLGDVESADLGLSLGEKGMNVSMSVSAREGTDLAKVFAATRNARGGVIRGIPLDGWLLAGGSTPTTEAAIAWSQKLAKMFGSLPGMPVDDAMTKAQQAMADAQKLMGQSSMAVSGTVSNGKIGLPLHMVAVYDTTNPAAVRAAMEQMMGDFVLPLPGTGLVAPIDPGAPKKDTPAGRLLVAGEAETVGDLKVSTFALNPEMAKQIPAMLMPMVNMILGEKPAVRITTLDKKVVLAVGGPDALKTAIEAVKAGKPLADSPRVAAVQDQMLAERTFEFYFDLGGTANLIVGIVKNMGLPIPDAAVASIAQAAKAPPIAVSACGAQRALKMRLTIPKATFEAVGKMATLAVQHHEVRAGNGGDDDDSN